MRVFPGARRWRPTFSKRRRQGGLPSRETKHGSPARRSSQPRSPPPSLTRVRPAATRGLRGAHNTHVCLCSLFAVCRKRATDTPRGTQRQDPEAGTGAMLTDTSLTVLRLFVSLVGSPVCCVASCVAHKMGFHVACCAVQRCVPCSTAHVVRRMLQRGARYAMRVQYRSELDALTHTHTHTHARARTSNIYFYIYLYLIL
jgi:hypothetical protein